MLKLTYTFFQACDPQLEDDCYVCDQATTFQIQCTGAQFMVVTWNGEMDAWFGGTHATIEGAKQEIEASIKKVNATLLAIGQKNLIGV